MLLKLKIWMDTVNSKLDTTENQISESEDKLEKFPQNSQEK